MDDSNLFVGHDWEMYSGKVDVMMTIQNHWLFPWNQVSLHVYVSPTRTRPRCSLGDPAGGDGYKSHWQRM